MQQFNNLIEVTTFFADQAKATDYLIRMRWPNGIRCAHCNHAKVYEMKKTVKIYKCAQCRKQFSATKGTIFENSAIPLQKWFIAMYLIASHKKGISSCQLARDLSLTQKSAWFVLHRVRFVFQTGTFVHSKDAIIEIDETFVGGDTKNKHEHKIERNDKGHAISTKTPVIGILERGGKITTKAVKNTHKKTLLPEIYDNVEPGTKIMTDDYPGYKDLAKIYDHQTVNHSEKEYVRGNVYTNGIENFWSLFQRGVIGIYHHTSTKHLDKYLDEFEFRFNTRKNSEGERFGKAVSLVSKRLTYAQLIRNGKAESFIKFRPVSE
jgi:transposase-like protein